MKAINELLKLENEWLDEVYDRLWYEYFTPEIPLSPDMKKHIREQLNFIADEYNDKFKSETAQLKKITAKETWENDGNGPLSERQLYVACLPAVVVEAPKTKKKSVKAEDEDLLGTPVKVPMATAVHVTKFKKEKVAPPAGKTKYEAIAELAAKGKNKDQIQEITGFERKTVTDLLWRWNKLNPKK